MREKLYERVGMKSSYFFRLDDLHIVDATRMGYIGRFMNHHCEVSLRPCLPSCPSLVTNPSLGLRGTAPHLDSKTLHGTRHPKAHAQS